MKSILKKVSSLAKDGENNTYASKITNVFSGLHVILY